MIEKYRKWKESRRVANFERDLREFVAKYSNLTLQKGQKQLGEQFWLVRRTDVQPQTEQYLSDNQTLNFELQQKLLKFAGIENTQLDHDNSALAIAFLRDIGR